MSICSINRRYYQCNFTKKRPKIKIDLTLLKAILQYVENNADGGETDHIPTADNFKQFSEVSIPSREFVLF